MDGLNLDVVEFVYIVLILSNLILDLLDLPIDSQLHIFESLVVGILELGLLVLILIKLLVVAVDDGFLGLTD